MVRLRHLFLTLVSLATPLAVSAQPYFVLRTSAAETDGVVRFTLSANCDRQFSVTVPSGATAEEKAALIQAAVAGPSLSTGSSVAPCDLWRATGLGDTLSFQYFDPEEGRWFQTYRIHDYVDTSGGVTGLSTDIGGQNRPTFDFQIDEGTLAAGFDAFGNPSFIAISIRTSEGIVASKLPLERNTTPEAILQALSDFLQERGIAAWNASPTKLLFGFGEDVTLSWKVNDVNVLRGISVGFTPGTGSQLIGRDG